MAPAAAANVNGAQNEMARIAANAGVASGDGTGADDGAGRAPAPPAIAVDGRTDGRESDRRRNGAWNRRGGESRHAPRGIDGDDRGVWVGLRRWPREAAHSPMDLALVVRYLGIDGRREDRERAAGGEDDEWDALP